MKTNSELLSQTSAVLKGKWSNPIITSVVYFLITLGVAGVFTLLGPASCLSVLVSIPLGWGFTVIFLKYFRTQENIEFSELFQAFNKEQYLRVLGTMLLNALLVFLWALLLLVPGIIKAYAYKLVPFILKENPELSYMDVLRKSEEMMQGHKMQYFLLYLICCGLGMFSILTLGIGLIWLIPYMQTLDAAFYEEVKAEYEGKVVDATVID